MDRNIFDLNNIIICEKNTKLSDSIKEQSLKEKKKKCRHKRKVILDKKNDYISLIITQKVRVKKKKSNCIVNLNTNIVYNRTEKRNNHRKNKHSKNKINCKSSLSSIERTVPMCFRCKCVNQRRKCDKRIKDEKEKHHLTNSNKKTTSQVRHENENKHPKKYQHIDINHNDKTQSLTPISLEPLPDDIIDVSYDDISLNSFSSETEIDTLIERTKKREKRIEDENLEYIEISSDNNESIHSVATYILETVPVQSYCPTSFTTEHKTMSNNQDQNIIDESDKRFDYMMDSKTKLMENEPYISTGKFIVVKKENNTYLELSPNCPKAEYYEVPIEYIKKDTSRK